MLEKKLKIQINRLFDKLNIRAKNNLIIHSNSAGLLQFYKKKKKVFNIFLDILKQRVSRNGTIVFPTYNYNRLKKHKDLSISQVGLLTNFVLKKKEFSRTLNPIFSHAIYGKLTEELNKENINVAFGTKDSFFQKLINYNFKIIGFCCPVNSITLLHHLEVLANVNYRYKKNFKFKLKKKKFSYNYFVGKKAVNYKLKEDKIRKLLMKKNIIKFSKFGRFECWSVDSKNLKKIVLQKLKKKKNYLIK